MQASRQRGITRRLLAATEIQRRALLAMVNEAALLLAQDLQRLAHESGHGFVLADLSALLNP